MQTSYKTSFYNSYDKSVLQSSKYSLFVAMQLFHTRFNFFKMPFAILGSNAFQLPGCFTSVHTTLPESVHQLFN